MTSNMCNPIILPFARFGFIQGYENRDSPCSIHTLLKTTQYDHPKFQFHHPLLMLSYYFKNSQFCFLSFQKLMAPLQLQ
jgi:hypothetical protein